MQTSIKIGLIIAVAVALVALISFSVGPKDRPFIPNPLVTNQTPGVQNFENIPRFLQRSFPETDFSQADPAIQNILSGGPGKDGIPAIDEPTFISLDTFDRPDDVQAIVLEDGDGVKVYPYNILTWHEIVNDTANDNPVAITFCPLCGSAIVFNRELETGVTTFGVSGALIESNMVMYDRATESLWQQSTGKALAGELFGSTLELHPFQLFSMGEVRERYPDALVLSEDTGHRRDYGRNPYSGYNENDVFIFQPSSFDERFDAKEIMAVFRVGDAVAATPWVTFIDGMTKTAEVDGVNVTLTKSDGELTITAEDGTEYPFFFEMWFSFAVQNPDGVVVD